MARETKAQKEARLASEAGNIGSNASPKEEVNGNTTGDVTEVVSKLVWLKQKAYISDRERVSAGVYGVPADKVPSRLLKMNKEAVEIFDEVSSRVLARIARWAGLNPDGMSDEEILAKVVSSEFKPFV